METKRAWTLEAAREMMPEVRIRTQQAVAAVDALSAERDSQQADSKDRQAIEARLRSRVSRWIREMEALGVDVKGLWLIDFDNGRGYYCWRWPEAALEYFHDYETGFNERVRIQ